MWFTTVLNLAPLPPNTVAAASQYPSMLGLAIEGPMSWSSFKPPPLLYMLLRKDCIPNSIRQLSGTGFAPEHLGHSRTSGLPALDAVVASKSDWSHLPRILSGSGGPNVVLVADVSIIIVPGAASTCKGGHVTLSSSPSTLVYLIDLRIEYSSIIWLSASIVRTIILHKIIITSCRGRRYIIWFKWSCRGRIRTCATIVGSQGWSRKGGICIWEVSICACVGHKGLTVRCVGWLSVSRTCNMRMRMITHRVRLVNIVIMRVLWNGRWSTKLLAIIYYLATRFIHT